MLKKYLQTTTLLLVFLLTLPLGGCPGSKKNNNTPPSLASQLQGATWTIASSSVPSAATFAVQRITLNADGTSSTVVYPATTGTAGTWTADTGSATLTVVAGAATFTFTNVSVSGNTASASITIPAGVAGKVAAVTTNVTYNK